MSPGDGRDVLHVLLVDDNVTLASLLGRILGELGCEVSTATGADGARALVDHADFDVVVCDASLVHDNDGLALLEWVRERSPRSLRVLLSGRPPDDSEDTSSVECFLMKPALGNDLRGLLAWARDHVRTRS